VRLSAYRYTVLHTIIIYTAVLIVLWSNNLSSLVYRIVFFFRGTPIFALLACTIETLKLKLGSIWNPLSVRVNSLWSYVQLDFYSAISLKHGIDMSLHSDILSWFRANQSLLLLLNAACLAEKQQIPIFYSLVCQWLATGPPVSSTNKTDLTTI
jgi:hypothetical protein